MLDYINVSLCDVALLFDSALLAIMLVVIAIVIVALFNIVLL